MKKAYMAPNTMVLEVEYETILAASGNGVYSDDMGMGFGGSDTEGKDAEAKPIGSCWDAWE